MTFPEPLPASHPFRFPPRLTEDLRGIFPAPPHIITSGLSHVSEPRTLSAVGNGRSTKAPSISYKSSVGETHERALQFTRKPLIIVIPSSFLTQENGRFRRMLPFGPHERFSQGIILPLCLTMQGQLAAIAREFKFPSTKGICLYYHLSENGAASTPRISEQSWSFLWSRALDDGHLPENGIHGKIEFDVDTLLARWYTSWTLSCSRNYSDPHLMASSTSFQTFTDSSTQLHQNDVSQSLNPVHCTPSSRLGLRRLSLLENLSQILVTRSPEQSPKDQQQKKTSEVLSPILQENEVKKTNEILDKKVDLWRASTVISSSLNVANVANNEEAKIGTPSEFDQLIASTGSDEHHMSTDVMKVGIVPSPDIAYRALEVAPLTPLTATSWGASFSYPPSPSEHYKASLIDFTLLMSSTKPITPSHATCFGPNGLVSPISPTTDRTTWSLDVGIRSKGCKRFTPVTSTSWGLLSSLPASPLRPIFVATPDLGNRSICDQGCLKYPITGKSQQMLSEYDDWYERCNRLLDNFKPTSSQPESKTLSCPFYCLGAEAAENCLSHDSRNMTSSTLPYYDHGHVARDSNLAATLQSFSLIYPHFDLYPSKVLKEYAHLNVKQSSSMQKLVRECVYRPHAYSYFDLYPAIYPSFSRMKEVISYYNLNTMDICSERQKSSVALAPVRSSEHSTCSSVGIQSYPFFNLYPGVRPMIEMTNSAANYPAFDLYPPIAPWTEPFTGLIHK